MLRLNKKLKKSVIWGFNIEFINGTVIGVPDKPDLPIKKIRNRTDEKAADRNIIERGIRRRFLCFRKKGSAKIPSRKTGI
jgi:hypothetical protein